MSSYENKWFLEVVQDTDGKYYANMIKGGKRVEGLPEYVDYNTLRDGIRLKTGIQILKKKDMKFSKSGRKSYAFLDNTRVRNDCRVTLDEIIKGFRPDFRTLKFNNQTIYIPPKESHVLNLSNPCILAGTIREYDPAISTENFSYAGNVKVHIAGEIHPDGSENLISRTLDFYDSPSLYVTSLEEAEKLAGEVYKRIEMIKSFPRSLTPAGDYGRDYFEAINLKALSDMELVQAKELAKEFVGPQSIAVSKINREMQQRFEERARKPLSDRIQNAVLKSQETISKPAQKSKETEHSY